MTIHKLRLLESFADPMLSGEKNFDIRRNDRPYQRGDFVQYQTFGYDRATKEDYDLPHEIEDHTYKITYVMSGWGLRVEFVAFGLEDLGVIDPGGDEI